MFAGRLSAFSIIISLPFLWLSFALAQKDYALNPMGEGAFNKGMELVTAALSQANRQPTSNQYGATAQNNDESTSCLIQCIQAMQSMELQIPDVRSMERNFGEWMEKPYREFVFQTVCGTYTSHKGCLHQCPESKAKEMALAAMAPLDYVCIEHYDEFLKNLQCFLKAKVKITTECTQKCGTMETLLKNMQVLQHKNLGATTQAQEALTMLCDFASCRHSCYRPILLDYCGVDGTSLVDKFTASSTAGFLQELEAMGYADISPNSCLNLAEKEIGFLEEDERSEIVEEPKWVDVDLSQLRPAYIDQQPVVYEPVEVVFQNSNQVEVIPVPVVTRPNGEEVTQEEVKDWYRPIEPEPERTQSRTPKPTDQALPRVNPVPPSQESITTPTPEEPPLVEVHPHEVQKVADKSLVMVLTALGVLMGTVITAGVLVFLFKCRSTKNAGDTPVKAKAWAGFPKLISPRPEVHVNQREVLPY